MKMVNCIQLENLDRQEQTIIPLGADNGLNAFITLKAAGDMSFQKRNFLPDRKAYFKRAGIDPSGIFSVYQEHTREVIQIKEETCPADYAEIRADGLIAQKQEIFLAVTVADCLPVYLYDKSNGAFGIVHSGWKGTGIVLNAIALMEAQCGCRREHLKAVLGPGIGCCCYAVDRGRYMEFFGCYGADSVLCSGDNYYLDLRKANLFLLESNGVKDITVIGNCTVCGKDFHSYRRDGAAAFKLMLAYLGYGRHLL